MRKVQEYSGCWGMLKTLRKDKLVWPQDLGGFEQGLQYSVRSPIPVKTILDLSHILCCEEVLSLTCEVISSARGFA